MRSSYKWNTSGGKLDNQTWQTEWKTAPLAKVQVCEYENQTLEASVAVSRLSAEFDCPVAHQNILFLPTAQWWLWNWLRHVREQKKKFSHYGFHHDVVSYWRPQKLLMHLGLLPRTTRIFKSGEKRSNWPTVLLGIWFIVFVSVVVVVDDDDNFQLNQMRQVQNGKQFVYNFNAVLLLLLLLQRLLLLLLLLLIFKSDEIRKVQVQKLQATFCVVHLQIRWENLVKLASSSYYIQFRSRTLVIHLSLAQLHQVRVQILDIPNYTN